nr:MAG TPA: hypothetical protein [Caudoviricetes sp.]
MGFDSPTCHSFVFQYYLRLLPARESRHSHTATESAKRCIFTRKGRAALLVIGRQLVHISLSLGGSTPPVVTNM